MNPTQDEAQCCEGEGNKRQCTGYQPGEPAIPCKLLKARATKTMTKNMMNGERGIWEPVCGTVKATGGKKTRRSKSRRSKSRQSRRSSFW